MYVQNAYAKRWRDLLHHDSYVTSPTNEAGVAKLPIMSSYLATCLTSRASYYDLYTRAGKIKSKVEKKKRI